MEGFELEIASWINFTDVCCYKKGKEKKKKWDES